MYSKILLFTSILFLLTTACKNSAIESGSDTRPNIIYILTDDMGYGDLGCYGQEEIKTPNIDKLANEGMRFLQHYAGSTVCAPSRSVLMTGVHTGHAWIRGNYGMKPMGQFPLADSIVTIAEILKEAGYRTGAIGKWGLGGPETEGDPMNQGFDHFFGYKCQSHAHNYYPEFIYLNRDTFKLKNVMPKPVASNQTGFATTRIDYTPDLFAKDAKEFISKNRKDPFFLYLALTPPHVNNEAPKGLGMEVPDQGEYAGKEWPSVEIDKAAMITRMDSDIGSILVHLKEQGLDEHTIVFFSSDNGPHKEGSVNPEFFKSSGKFRGVKRDLYEGGIRVPFIANWPGKIKPGSISMHVSAFWDFLPTACEIAGIQIPGNTDGISFLNELTGKPQKKHESLYWEYPVNSGKLAMRYQDWKAVMPNLRDNPNKIELYDLSVDPAETTDIAAKHPEIISLITEMMKSSHQPSEKFPLNMNWHE